MYSTDFEFSSKRPYWVINLIPIPIKSTDVLLWQIENGYYVVDFQWHLVSLYM